MLSKVLICYQIVIKIWWHNVFWCRFSLSITKLRRSFGKLTSILTSATIIWRHVATINHCLSVAISHQNTTMTNWHRLTTVFNYLLKFLSPTFWWQKTVTKGLLSPFSPLVSSKQGFSTSVKCHLTRVYWLLPNIYH